MVYGESFPVAITAAFLKAEKNFIDSYCSTNNDPGDPERIKLNSMFRRVSVGLSQIIRSLNKDTSSDNPYLPDFILKKMNIPFGKSYEFYDEVKKRFVVFEPKELFDYTSIQRQNIAIWKDEYSLLLWEIEIRGGIDRNIRVTL